MIEEEYIRKPGGVNMTSEEIALEERRQVFFYFVCSFFLFYSRDVHVKKVFFIIL